MTLFQKTALLFTITWLLVVVIRFRRSPRVLIGGLFGMGLYTTIALVFGWASPNDLGLAMPASWLFTVLFSLGWLALMLIYSPLADQLVSRWFEKPPTLEAFRGLQRSWGNLISGILAAWVLGGILEELLARGIVLQALQTFFSPWLPGLMAEIAAILLAGLGAGLMHLYQGPRAAAIITQLSFLFGLLFVMSGNNLWAVMLCHGLYDTIAFVRFALGKSKYSRPNPGRPLSPGTSR
jgi:membrane protease YdiL (CAAX protease family)